jgi:branched-chain amino acid transport system substrate-binding protein
MFTLTMAVTVVFVQPAAAQDKIKIGLVYTLSGPAAALGQQSRDAFNLAIKELGGRMAARDVEVISVDDELKPDVAVQKVKGLLDRDKVDFVVGPIFSNVLQAIHNPVIESGRFLISSNSGPSLYAGKGCSPNFFMTSYQNDVAFEALGKVAQDSGYKRMYLMVPNYQAGKDAIAGFKRYYRGGIVDEVFVPLNTLDFQAELARLASSDVDALFTFMPGGMGINLIKQFDQAGLKARIPVLSGFTVDEATLPAVRDAGVGLLGALTWAPNMDNPQNKKFVAAYEAAYSAVPASYAMQAYDTAMLIDSAVRHVGADLSRTDGVRDGLKNADFSSLRGKFKFNVNGYPIQNLYLTKAAKRPDGKYQTEIVKSIFEDHGDAYAQDCKSS